MGILSRIAKRKESFHKTREAVAQFKTDVAVGRMERQQKANLREAEITKARQELRESQQIHADLKADQQKGEGPSKLKKFGQGLARTMDKGKKAHRSRRVIGAPQSSGSSGLQMGGGGRGSPFGGQRPLDTGGGGGGFTFGPTPKPKPEKKRPSTTIIIKH